MAKTIDELKALIWTTTTWGTRERLLLIKVGLSKNGKEGGRHVNSKQQVVHSTTLPFSLLRFSSFFLLPRMFKASRRFAFLHLHKQIQLSWGHFLSRLVRGRHWRTRHQDFKSTRWRTEERTRGARAIDVNSFITPVLRRPNVADRARACIAHATANDTAKEWEWVF